ncbi:MAG: hypothetical protein ABH952_05545 [Candidatus Omnitrophota bacterium]
MATTDGYCDEKRFEGTSINTCHRIAIQIWKAFWQEGQAVQEILGIELFTTDDIYNTLDWLDQHQVVFEKKLFQSRYGKKKIKLFLYDITSSYFEGKCIMLNI